jgi:fumarate reductase subunit C
MTGTVRPDGAPQTGAVPRVRAEKTPEALARPRAYRPRVSVFWWAHKRSYLLFVMRELSSVFVAWFVVVTLLFAWSVARGEEQYQRFLDIAANPLIVAVNVVALAFLVLHTVTWFNLTPQAMPLRLPKRMPGDLGGRRVPSAAIVAAQWAGFVVVSAFMVWLVVG